MYLSYAWARSWDSTEAQPDTLHIGLPAIGSEGATSLPVAIPLVRRLGSAIVSVSNGDVGFDIVPISLDTVAFRNPHISWQLEIPRACHTNVSAPMMLMHGNGAIPGHLLVPRASFAGAFDSTTACLATQSFHEPKFSSYPIGISNSSRIEWRVRIP